MLLKPGCLVFLLSNQKSSVIIAVFSKRPIRPNATLRPVSHSRSQKGVLRGLHLQKTRPQGKLVSCSRGVVYDVAVDVNPQSDTFGQYVGVELTEDNHRQLWIPPGYAHGFCVLSDVADFQYKCTDLYFPEDEGGLIWNDPEVAIDWPIDQPALSEKDQKLPTLAQIRANGGV